MSESNQNSDNKKSTLKIISEIDKEIIIDSPPNFNNQNYTKIHDKLDGTLHG